MPEANTKPSELEELQEQQRVMTQIRQLESVGMVDHIAKKLGMGRKRLKKTWQDANQLPEKDSDESDDMGHVLARDIVINEAPQETATTVSTTTATEMQTSPSRWPLAAAAVALGLGVPTTTALLMAPSIITALKPTPAAVTPAKSQEYAPILLPGKPQGAK